MTLYHGSNQDIVSIDLEKGLMYKDFGKGFYLTPDKATAIRMAQKKARIFGGEPTLITYELDEKGLNSEIKVKRFPAKANVDWFLFIDANRDRKQKQPVHNYDIVIGPIADDGVVLQLANFHQGIYSAQDAARYLQDRYLDQQYFFGTDRSLKYLRKL